MDCLQLLPGQVAAPVCPFITLPDALMGQGAANTLLVIAVLAGLSLFIACWRCHLLAFGAPPPPQTPEERAERLLRASLTRQEYQHLAHFGYLELPSRLYPNRYYRIVRARRVQVYTVVESDGAPQPRKVGELCVVACEPTPDADMFLIHKWLLEADEAEYLNTANWV